MQTFIYIILFHNKLLRKLKKCVAEATHEKCITPNVATHLFCHTGTRIEDAFLPI